MARNRQRELTLAAVAVALISIATWRLQSGASAPPGAIPQADTAVPSATSSKPKSATAEVDLQSLQADRPEPVDTNRNPFTFKPKPQPPPSPRDPGGQQRSPLGSTPPSEPPQPARIPMKFIGIIHSSDPKLSDIAVLSDGRGVYQGRVNEIIEGRYRILRIGIESIELAYLDGRGSQTISLTGQ